MDTSNRCTLVAYCTIFYDTKKKLENRCEVTLLKS